MDMRIGVGAHYVRPSARSSRARRPCGSNSRPGEHEQRRVRVDLAPGALRAHRFVPARRCAPPKLRRGGPAPSPGDARRRRGHGPRHRRCAADQGRSRGLSALGMQAQVRLEVRAHPRTRTHATQPNDRGWRALSPRAPTKANDFEGEKRKKKKCPFFFFIPSCHAFFPVALSLFFFFFFSKGCNRRMGGPDGRPSTPSSPNSPLPAFLLVSTPRRRAASRALPSGVV